MTNLRFPRLNKPRLSPKTFHKLKGLVLPFIKPNNTSDTGLIGKAFDNYLKTMFKQPVLNTGVDLVEYGVELKTRDIRKAESCWSIGSMTMEDIIIKPYVDSLIYEKMQALTLITYDSTMGYTTDVILVYLDNDETQTIIEESYEEARALMKSFYNNHLYTQNSKSLFVGGSIDPVEFSRYQTFKGKSAHFEHTNSGTSFQFRITPKNMKRLVSISTTLESFSAMF